MTGTDTLILEERAWYARNCVEEEEEEFIAWPPLPTPTPRPPVDTCSQVPADIVVSGYRSFSTQCQGLGAAGVGNDTLIAQGILDALDVWATVDAEARVCFRLAGTTAVSRRGDLRCAWFGTWLRRALTG